MISHSKILFYIALLIALLSAGAKKIISTVRNTYNHMKVLSLCRTETIESAVRISRIPNNETNFDFTLVSKHRESS